MHYKLLIALSLVLASCAASSKREELIKEKPNVIFIFADDQCYNTIGALGNTEVITPNLDKLVDNGITFTHAYNMGAWNGAVCQASRTMLNSGLPVWKAYEHQEKVYNKGKGAEKSWAKLMEAEGYDTYMTGKWHVHLPAQKAFMNTTHIRPGMPKDNWDHFTMVQNFKDLEEGKKWDNYLDFMPIGYNRPLGEDDHSWSPVDSIHGGFWQGGQHWSEALRDDALTFINQTKQSDKPFFMYLAFNAPHDPRQAPQEYQDMYDINELSIPENFQELYPEREAIDNGPSLRDAALAPFPRTEYATKVHKKEYFASITHLDAQIGAIIEALEASGKADNTYIIYTADHGLAVGEHGLFGKQNMYDHSVRAPFIFYGPGLDKGKKVNAQIYLQDAMATALDFAGSTSKDSVFFKSILPLAIDESGESAYDAIYGGYLNCQRMVSDGQYKLILYPEVKALKLFDLVNDPLEMNNLASEARYQDRIRVLFMQLQVLQEEVGDKLDLTAFYNI